MAHPLEVLADLTLAVDGEDVEIRGDGDLIIIDLPSLRTGRKLLGAGPFRREQRSQGANQVNGALKAAGLTVDVRLRGDTIARLGARAQPNAIARLLNLGDFEVRPARTVATAARTRPYVAIALAAGAALIVAYFLFRGSSD